MKTYASITKAAIDNTLLFPILTLHFDFQILSIIAYYKFYVTPNKASRDEERYKHPSHHEI